MFEDPNGIKYIGTPVSTPMLSSTMLMRCVRLLTSLPSCQAWKTKNYYSHTSRLEQGEGFEKKLDDRSPERNENVAPEKMA